MVYIAFISGFDDDQYERASLNSNLDGRVSPNGSLDEGVSPDSNLIWRASFNSNSDWRAFSVQGTKVHIFVSIGNLYFVYNGSEQLDVSTANI